MTEETYFYGHFSKYLARFQGALELLFLLGLCGFDFFFPTAYRLQAGIHGVSAITAVVFANLFPLILSTTFSCSVTKPLRVNSY